MKPLEETTYVMVNPVNGAKITCTEKYLVMWLARGFIVDEIIRAK